MRPGRPKKEWKEWLAEIEEQWGTEEIARRWLKFNPSHVGDPEWIGWLAKAMRHGASPAAALAFNEVEAEMDVRSGLGARVGTLAGQSEVLVSQTVKDLVAGS